MKKTIFYNTNPVAISTRLNEYMKSNFGYAVDGDLASLREAKVALEAQKRELRADHQDRAYVENMLMLETIKSLLKAHVAEGELPPGLKAYQDKKKDKAPKKDKAKSDKMPMDAGKDGKMGTKDDKPAFLKNESVNKEFPVESKTYNTKSNVGKAKYVVNFHDGEKTHKDGSPFYDMSIFKNAKDLENFEKQLKSKGYVAEDVKEVAEGKYKSDAQRKAVHAAKAEKANEGETPKFDTMTKYSNTYEAPKEYKMKKEKLEEGLMAQLNALLEADAADAEITMAARGIVDELQDMIEKLGKIQNDQLGPLADEMAYSHGPEQSAAFKEATDSAIAGLLGQARSTKDAVNDAVLVLTGQQPASDMAATGAELGGDMGADMEDDISMDMDLTGGDDSMSGPEDEPLGRAKR